MAVAIRITRTELSAAELRAVAARSRDAQAARRMLAVALVLEGADRTTAAETCGMDRQTLRDWVHRYNAEGPAATPVSARRCAPDEDTGDVVSLDPSTIKIDAARFQFKSGGDAQGVSNALTGDHSGIVVVWEYEKGDRYIGLPPEKWPSLK